MVDNDLLCKKYCRTDMNRGKISITFIRVEPILKGAKNNDAYNDNNKKNEKLVILTKIFI